MSMVRLKSSSHWALWKAFLPLDSIALNMFAKAQISENLLTFDLTSLDLKKKILFEKFRNISDQGRANWYRDWMLIGRARFDYLHVCMKTRVCYIPSHAWKYPEKEHRVLGLPRGWKGMRNGTASYVNDGRLLCGHTKAASTAQTRDINGNCTRIQT